MSLDVKIQEFNAAMDRYHQNSYYSKFGLFVATLVIIFQFLSVINLYSVALIAKIDPLYLFLSFFIAYFITDFINGIIHLLMDNNTHYKSIIGPLIAAFHMHHKQPLYKNRHPIKIYFYESGAKVWLPIYLLMLLCAQIKLNMPFYLHFILVTFGILSSVAEVSHYWCHNSYSASKLVKILQKYNILLSPKHHKHHHMQDNMHYAFLNGMTDPLINLIAQWFFKGYKNNADLHAKAHILQTSNRA